MEHYFANPSMLQSKNFDSMMPFSESSCWKFADSLSSPVKNPAHMCITGSSVLGMVFDRGVVICADTLCSYGTLARYPNCDRVVKVNDRIILGMTGDYADYQFVSDFLKWEVIEEESLNDGFKMQPKSLLSFLTRTLYNRRSQASPLWNTFIVGGIQYNSPFLGLVNYLGTAYTSPTVESGYGLYLAQPLLAAAYESNPCMSEFEAKLTLMESMRILYYRDRKAFSRYKFAVATLDGVKIEGPYQLETEWSTSLSQC